MERPTCAGRGGGVIARGGLSCHAGPILSRAQRRGGGGGAGGSDGNKSPDLKTEANPRAFTRRERFYGPPSGKRAP